MLPISGKMGKICTVTNVYELGFTIGHDRPNLSRVAAPEKPALKAPVFKTPALKMAALWFDRTVDAGRDRVC